MIEHFTDENLYELSYLTTFLYLNCIYWTENGVRSQYMAKIIYNYSLFILSARIIISLK